MGIKHISQPINIFWFRRDLRLTDNHGFYQATKGDFPVLPIFIFDTNILSELEPDDARVTFIYQCLQSMQFELRKRHKGLKVFIGKPQEVWKTIIKNYNVKQVFTNRDYEPYAQQRDKAIYELLKENEIEFKGFKDHVIFEKKEILTDKGEPYTVFTPYSKKWRQSLNQYSFQEYDSGSRLSYCLTIDSNIPSLGEIGFKESNQKVPKYNLSTDLLNDYKEQRDFPAISGTSKLSPHLRFGTISVREVYRQTQSVSETFINEIIWRDFYAQVLYNYPRVINNNFKKKYDNIVWRNNKEEFVRWCEGKTGFPIVDAGMRQLNQTGWMHNRVRMITASFLCKDLLIDWRWGEAYFAKKLLDFDLASNNGGWQWAAGTGTDAAPYFRIFNPESQLKKFDPQLKYVKKWIPEYGTAEYPKEMVNHKEARKRTLEAYKLALDQSGKE